MAGEHDSVGSEVKTGEGRGSNQLNKSSNRYFGGNQRFNGSGVYLCRGETRVGGFVTTVTIQDRANQVPYRGPYQEPVK